MASMDLKKSEVKPIFGFGNDLVVFRGNSGKVYVLYAYCPHLGANIGEGGTVEGEDIKCPFHGWTFNNEGKCISVPGIEAVNTPKAEIKVWECIEVNGFIFVWNHSKGEKSNYVIEPIDGISSEYVYNGKFEYLIDNVIQDIPENNADLGHILSLHFQNPQKINLKRANKKSIELEGMYTFYNFIYLKLTTSWKLTQASYITEFANKFKIILGGNSFIELFKVFGNTIGPTYLSMHYILLGKILFHSPTVIIPVAPNRVMLIEQFYSVRGSLVSYILCKILLIFIRKELGKDVPIWNNKRYVSHPYITKNDQGINLYRKWCQQFY